MEIPTSGRRECVLVPIPIPVDWSSGGKLRSIWCNAILLFSDVTALLLPVGLPLPPSPCTSSALRVGCGHGHRPPQPRRCALPWWGGRTDWCDRGGGAGGIAYTEGEAFEATREVMDRWLLY